MQSIIALGFFDGVHLGHGELLRRIAALAAETGWRSLALTFDRSPGKDGRLLTTVPDRVRLIQSLYGIQAVEVLPFTEEFMHLPWEAFLELLVRDYGAAHLVCGWDYRFGYLGAGTPELLRQWCTAHGLGCDVIPPLVIEGVTVSSTHLKALIEAGDMETAARFYGHPHTISGVVQPGRHLGHTLGFPTANLLPPPELVLPRDGVYAVKATLGEPGGQARLVPTEDAGAVAHTVRRYGEGPERRLYSGVCNVGRVPPADGGDLAGRLRGRPLRQAADRGLLPLPPPRAELPRSGGPAGAGRAGQGRRPGILFRPPAGRRPRMPPPRL